MTARPAIVLFEQCETTVERVSDDIVRIRQKDGQQGDDGVVDISGAADLDALIAAFQALKGSETEGRA
jgi:hypothetical protein